MFIFKLDISAKIKYEKNILMGGTELIPVQSLKDNICWFKIHLFCNEINSIKLSQSLWVIYNLK